MDFLLKDSWIWNLNIAASGPVIAVTEDKDANKSNNKVESKSEFDDLFDGLDWVTPSLNQEPCKQVENISTNLSKKVINLGLLI